MHEYCGYTCYLLRNVRVNSMGNSSHVRFASNMSRKTYLYHITHNQTILAWNVALAQTSQSTSTSRVHCCDV